MEKFRRDVNTVFSRQQSGLGNTAGVSNRLLQRALAPLPARRRFAPQLAAALATLLLGAAVAYVAVVARGHLKSQSPVTRVAPTVRASASASAVPGPTPLSRPFVAPSSTPAILYFDPVDSRQVDGVTWDGNQRGVLGAVGQMGLVQNPAGSSYMSYPDIRDRSGHIIAQVVGHAKITTAWADNGQHYCQMVSLSDLPPPGGEPATLRIVTVAGSVRNVAQVGTMGQQGGAGVAACSVARDRAVVTQPLGIGAIQKWWLVQLSTGRILSTRASDLAAASHDAQYVAVNESSGLTAIYDANGAVRGHVQGSVQQFSWDGSLVVVAQYGDRPSVIDWRSGKVVWTAPVGTTYTGSLPEPGGARIAIEVQTPGHPQTGGYPIIDVYVVSPDGTAVRVLVNVSL